jgi:ATP-dependent Lon protease
VELQENILELSASLRNGEIEKYNQAKANYEAKLDEFAKYAEGSNVYEQLKSYKDWLDSGETDKLLYFNSKLSEYNRNKPQNIDEQVEQIRQLQTELNFSKTTSDDLAKLLSVAERTQKCMSYCFAEDFEALETEYRELDAKIKTDWEKINNEYMARLQSKALVESLENF